MPDLPPTGEQAPPALAIHNVSRSFGGIHAVRDATFDVQPATLTALIGPNGAGKSTLFNLVTGFERLDQGTVELFGTDVTSHPAHQLVSAGMTRTFQLTRALAGLSVLENACLAAQSQTGERLASLVFRPRRWRQEEDRIRARAHLVLDSLGLSAKTSEYAGNLSGGQKKLLELARALMTEPRLLLLDEPMAGVNPTLGRRIFDHIDELRWNTGLTVLFVEHDLELVMTRADRVIVMAEGTTLTAGSPAEVRADERVREAYLGRRQRHQTPEAAT